AEVGSELKAVVPVRPREVVNELIPGDVTPLREIKLRSDDIREVSATLWAERVYPTELQCLRECRQRQRLILRELGHVVAACRRKLVGHIGREDVRLLDLNVPGRLVRQRVEVGADGVQIARLKPVVQLIAHEHVVVLRELLVDLEGNNPLVRQGGRACLERCYAGLGPGIEARQGQTVTGGVVGQRLGIAGAFGVGKQIHHLRVQRELGWLQVSYIVQNRARERRRWDVRRDVVGQNKAQAFRIEEEES